MSEQINHECGIALVRLLKPLLYYQEKYGSPLWGFTKLFLLMEKQHNRGQDGAGAACVKLDVPAGEAFMFRERSVKPNPLDKIFKLLLSQYNAKVAAGTIQRGLAVCGSGVGASVAANKVPGARAALIADRTMSRVGLQGKSFIPLLSGYACAVPDKEESPPPAGAVGAGHTRGSRAYRRRGGRAGWRPAP